MKPKEAAAQHTVKTSFSQLRESGSGEKIIIKRVMNCIIFSWRRWDTQQECLPCVGSSWGWSRAARWAAWCSSAASLRSPDCGSALARRSPPHEPHRTSGPTTAENTTRTQMKNLQSGWDGLQSTGWLSLPEQFRSFWKSGSFLKGAADISCHVQVEPSPSVIMANKTGILSWTMMFSNPNQGVNTVR